MEPDEEASPGDQNNVKRTMVLNRAEINEILNNPAHLPNHGPFGMERLVHGGLVSYERLPMLEVVCDRLVRILAGNLRNLTQDNVDVVLKAIKSKRFGECLDESEIPAIFAVFEVKEWENFGVLIIEPAMIYSIVEVMMGGRQPTREPVDRRNFTSIERNLVERLVRLILTDLAASFAPICRASFQFTRIETDPRFAMVARVSSASIFAQISITIAKRQGIIDIILPYATIEPVREILLQQFMGEKFGRDTIWETHLAEELRQTDIDLEAVLDEEVMSLGVLLAMEAGTVIPLKARDDSLITIRCGGVPLFEACSAHRSGQMTAVIQSIIPRTLA